MATEICINIFSVGQEREGGNNVHLNKTVTWGYNYLYQQQADVLLFSVLEYLFVAFNIVLVIFVNQAKMYSA